MTTMMIPIDGLFGALLSSLSCTCIIICATASKCFVILVFDDNRNNMAYKLV